MSLNSILNTSVTGLFANQSAMSVTSNNIANVNTPNYSRSVVEQSAITTSGQGGGVTISSVSTVVDEFLQTAYRKSLSNTSEYSAQNDLHSRLQTVLGDPSSDSSLSARIDGVYSSISSLALNPSDVLLRQDTLSQVQSFFDQVNLFQGEIQELRGDADKQIAEDIGNVNDDLQRVYELNALISKQKILGGDTGSIQSQLTEALNSISENLDVKVTTQSTGAAYVYTSNGYPLVDTGLTQLSYYEPGNVDSDTIFSEITVSRVDPDTLEPTSSAVDFDQYIQSGRLAGLIDMRDNQLTDLASSLGELSAHFADELNAIQNAYSSVPAPQSMTGSQTLVDGSQATNFTGETTFAVVDSDNELVASVTIDFSTVSDFDDLVSQVNAGLGGAGTLTLTDGVMSLSATNASNGVVMADSDTNPSNRGGRGFSHFFGMNDIITADAKGIYDTGITGSEAHNMGTGESIQFKVSDSSGKELASINVAVTGTSYDDMVAELNDISTGLGSYLTFSLDDNGALTWKEKAGVDDLMLEVVSDTTEIGSTGLSFTEAFGIGDKYKINASRDLSIRSDIAENPELMALSKFDQSASVGDVVLTKGDQSGALALQELETTVVAFGEAGELNATSVTLSQYVSRFLGSAGLQAERAGNFEEDNQALLDEIAERNSNVSGVNLDEELSNLVIYQNAYNAAARILTTVQELYDALLAAV